VYRTGLGGVDSFNGGPNTPGVRLLRVHDGTLFASVPGQFSAKDRIIALPDEDGDGRPDETVTVVESPDIRDAHGFDIHDGKLYVVNHRYSDDEDTNVVRFDMNPDGLTADTSTRTVLTREVPPREDYFHWTRTLEVRDDGMYITVGSDTDYENPAGGWYARMTRCDLDGTNCESYADGLRNAVGFAFHDGKLFATDNGRGGDLDPPDEVNVVREGADYGFAYCYGDRRLDPYYGGSGFDCSTTEDPEVLIEPHSAPLGFDFYTGSAFPSEYQDDMYVAYHGSSGGPVAGYKVARIPYENGELVGPPEDFVTGFYRSDGEGSRYEIGDDIKGRPVDVAVGPRGDMYVSDDAGGTIYRVYYDAPNQPPTADFSVDPDPAAVGERVEFDGTLSTDGDGTVTRYEWDFDGDGDVDAINPTSNTTFTTAGERNVELTVTDDRGAMNTTSRTVTVEEAPTPAFFAVSGLSAPQSVQQGETVTLDANVTNTGEESATQEVVVRFDLDGDGALTVDEGVAQRSVTLDGGTTETVSFDVTVPTGLTPGTYEHGVFTEDDDRTAGIDVTLAPVGRSTTPPTDPDGDGLYEDVNGDEAVNVGDAQTIFANADDPAVQDNVAAFDFNDDGSVNVGDAQALFSLVTNGETA
jgi:glucose/arabinose dehydrogenase